MASESPAPDVLRWAECHQASVRALLESFGITLESVDADQAIPGSFWGDDEAGLIGNRLLARDDTPLHSILHEACHFVCMTPDRRAALHTNAGGDDEEENAVCYLQILLADHIQDYSAGQCMHDMDAWGYSFRLGSARAWFEQDAEEVRDWLSDHGLGQPGQVRT